MTDSPQLSADLEAPVLLLAMPQVQDPHFHRGVVLLLRHEEEGSLGFVLNRPTDTSLDEVLEDLEIGSWQGQEGEVAWLGGPVQPQVGSVLLGLEDAADEGSGDHQGGSKGGDGAVEEVLPGLGLTHHVGDLERLARNPPSRFRLFLGYAAWGAGQLMEEILRNDWLTAPVDPELIFHPDPEAAWEQAVRSVGIDPSSLPSWTTAVESEADEGSAN